MSVLDVQNLGVKLPIGGDRPQAVSDVSFAVEQREILCLVGESGSGKSVIAQAVMGLLPKTLPAFLCLGADYVTRLVARAWRVKNSSHRSDAQSGEKPKEAVAIAVRHECLLHHCILSGW